MRRTARETGGWPRSPSGSCAGTGARASATACPSPTRGRARAAIRGSGTGTPASRRSSGAASTPAAPAAELESLLAAQRADGFIGHTIFWDRPVSLTRLPFYNVASRGAFQTETIQPPLLAWAWRIAVGDPAAEPRIGAPDRLAGRATATSRATACSGSSSPTSRASTPRPSSTRSGAGARNGRIGFPLLVRRNRRLGFDARRIRDARRAGPLRGRSSTRSGRSRCRRSGGRR